MKRQIFSPIIFVGIGGILLIALFITSAASGITVDKPSSDHFNNKSYYGYFGLYQLIKGLNNKAVIDSKSYQKSDDKSVLIYVDSSESDLFLTEEAIPWISAGNSLVTDAKTAEIIFNEKILEFNESSKISFIPNELKDITDLETEQYLGLSIKEIFNEYDVIAENESGPYMIKGYIGEGSITVISDFDFFNNYFFKDDEVQKGYIIEFILRPFNDEKIYLREKLGTLTANPSFIRDFFTGNYSYITFQLVALFILMTIYLGKRFVRPQQLVIKKQKRITEHINAVANLYKRADAIDLIRSIDITFFKTVICKNRIPFNIKETDYNNAVKASGFKNGFILRETLQKIIKERKSDD